MTRQQLFEQIKLKKSFLCVGLDPDPDKIPMHLRAEEDPVFAFNKAIIDATSDLCVAYKPNTAFYEALGLAGWQSLQKTIDYINSGHPDIFTIADAKRGDIGNTSRMYAQAFLDRMGFDSITVAPYMGSDSVSPFLTYENKWVILLALTSNPGAADLQLSELRDGMPLYEKVLQESAKWGNAGNMMYVVGATRPSLLGEIRKVVPDHFLLVPGVGAQGGSLSEVASYGMNDHCGLLVNASRSILYASSKEDFAEAARREAASMQAEMAGLLGF